MQLHRLSDSGGFIGWEKCKSLHSFGPAIRKYFILHFIINGKGRIISSNGNFDLKKGQGFLISPGQINTYTADSQEPWEYIWVGIDDTPETRSALSRHGLDQSKTPFDFNESSEIFPKIKEECPNGKNKVLTKDIAMGYFYFMLDTVLCTDKKDSVPDNYIEKCYQFMESNLHLELSVEMMAKHLCISRSYLYRVFKSSLGISPQRALLDFKLDKADKLLQQHGGTVTQIAYSCGFCDTSHFSKAYLNKFGKHPKNSNK